MSAISLEFIAILGVGIVIGAMILAQGRRIRAELANMRWEIEGHRQGIHALRERLVYFEGLLDELRQALYRDTDVVPNMNELE